MRAPEHAIPAPPFPRELTWVNVAPLRMDKQRGRPVLVEFWDFCRVNSLRTLPYLQAWHERYADGRAARDRRAHRRLPARARAPRTCVAAVERLGIEYPVVDRRAARAVGLLRQRGLAGALPVGRRRARCYSLHYGEGAYQETEREIQALLGVERDARRRRCGPRTPRASLLPAQTADQPGAYSGPYEAGGVWAVLEGAGDGRRQRPRARRRRRPARTRSSSTRTTPQAMLDARGRRRRDLPRHLLHARRRLAGSSRVRSAVAQQADEPRRAVVARSRPRCPASRASAFGSAQRKCGW